MYKKNKYTKIDWDMLRSTPFDSLLAKKAAPRITDHNAENQKATAAHEAIHITFAVKHGSPILSVCIGTSTKLKKIYGNIVKGSTIDLIHSGTIGAIESYLAAGIFETLLDPNPGNFIANVEKENAIKSITIYRGNNLGDVSLRFFSDVDMVENFSERLLDELKINWLIIELVAKALLYYRDIDGYFPMNLLGQLSQFIRNELIKLKSHPQPSDQFMKCIEQLSPFVVKQSALEKKQHDKWMRENDLDTILSIIKSKRCKTSNLIGS